MSAIDVSFAQGNINWKAVRDAGVDAAIIRCGYGQDYKSQDDTKYVRNIEGALSVGIRVGVYLYSYASSESMGVGEAKHAIRLIAPYKDKLSFPVFIDVEETSKVPYSKAVCTGFLKTMHNAGYKAGIYTTTSTYKTYLKNISGCDMWWIAWLGNSAPSYADIWQYSWKGRINGISGDVDLDKIINDTPAPAPAPTPKGDDFEVLVRELFYSPKYAIMNGEDVKSVQLIIGATADGSYGPKSKAKCIEWQKKHGLKADGIFGPACYNAAFKH